MLELVNIWKDLLEVDHVPEGSDFFALGGDSIKAILLVSRIRQEFEIDLDIAFIYNNLIIDDMAQFIKQQNRNTNYE